MPQSKGVTQLQKLTKNARKRTKRTTGVRVAKRLETGVRRNLRDIGIDSMRGLRGPKSKESVKGKKK